MDDLISPLTSPLNDDPLVLQTSDHPGMKLVTHPFEGTGFGNWKRSMLIALSAKNKLCLIDGSSPKPSPTAVHAKTWQRCNDMVFSWILNALSAQIADSVLYCDTAKSVWDELQDRYDQTNGAQLYSVQKSLSDFSQGNDSITTYFTKIKAIWDEIDAMGMNPTCTCTCSCGSKQKQIKYLEDQKIVQFLMGLNDSYTTIRGALLMQNPLPKLGIVYNTLIQEERQRDIHNVTQFQFDSASLTARNYRPNMYRHNPYNVGGLTRENPRTHSSKSSYHIPTASRSQRPPVSASSSTDQFCNYCKKAGHRIEVCYRLKNRNKRYAANVQGVTSDSILGPYGTTQDTTLNSAQNQNIQMDSIEYVPSSVNFAGLFFEEATDNW
ncbi:hypothetical protein vseg_007144 [Gypsophila vaccaria]